MELSTVEAVAGSRTAVLAADAVTCVRAPAAVIAERQARRLARLLQAARGTRHYRQLLRGVDPGAWSLAGLPATGKPQLMRSFDARVTDPRITLDGLRRFCADPGCIATPYLDRYLVWESSGSTGQPGLFVQDDQAVAVYDALEATRRHSPRPWARLFDPFFLGERFAFVGAISGHFASHVSTQRLRSANPWFAHNARSFSILQPTAQLVAQLNAFSPSILATYPTAALMLAEEAAQGTLRVRLQEVWTGGEALSAAGRTRIEQAFGCALRNSYGASEFLPIAWECQHRRLHVNADWVILEAVDARHRPVPAGRLSHTTLLTNLANHVQPLIRFDIGDRIMLGAEPCRCGSALPTVEVQGRTEDLLRVRGRDGRTVTLLPLALTTVLEDQAGVFDFQLRQQEDGGLHLLLGPRAPRTGAAIGRCREALEDFLHLQGAADPRLVIAAAESLPLGRTGKLKRIVAAGSAA